MAKKIKVPKKTTGYGYVGSWKPGSGDDPSVGWFMPKFLCDQDVSRKYPDQPDVNNPYLAGERLFLCKITAVPVLDKKGRPITKLIPERKEQ